MYTLSSECMTKNLVTRVPKQQNTVMEKTNIPAKKISRQ